MSADDWAFLEGLTSSQFENGGHRTVFVPACVAVGATGNDMAAIAASVAEYYALMGAIYTAMLAVSGGTLGIGADEYDVSLNVLRGNASFANISQFAIRRPVTQDAAYQIVPQDFWSAMLLTTSGTRTYTLPAWSDMPDFVPPLLGKNRSGNNLTLARTGTDTIDAAATSVTVPTGSSWELYKSDTSGLWEARVFA